MKILTLVAAGAIVLSSATLSLAQRFTMPHPPVTNGPKGWYSTESYAFIDSKGSKWTAPAGTLTDGASIPQAFMSAIGDRMDKRYLGAALIHDAYCAEANRGKMPFYTRPWQDVHKMFHEACLAGGTDATTALAMYTAVWLFGPAKWDLIAPASYATNKPGKSVQKDRLGNKLKVKIKKPSLSMGKPIGDSGETISKSVDEEQSAADARREAAASALRVRQMEAQAMTVPADTEQSLKQRQFEELTNFINAKKPSVEQLDSVMRLVVPKLKKHEVLEIAGEKKD